jgi:polysaccharide export outer membrane protein
MPPDFLRKMSIPRWVRGTIFFALFVGGLTSVPGAAQQLPPALAEQLQRSQSTPSDQSVQNPAVPQNAVPQNNDFALSSKFGLSSRLEQILSARAGTSLKQFGYDQLGNGRSVTVPQTGAVQDDYVLGPGDEIIISLRGQENNRLVATVDRNGQVVLPRLPPIAASGRSFGSFREDLNASVHRAYVATDASVSIGRVRQISVLVSGEVNQPGAQLLTGLSSALDAVLLSGGIKKTGSLRDVRIQRGGRTYSVDLYNVLTERGGTQNFRLADGDRILVPPLGHVVAITGLVRQPGIFELAPRTSSITARALRALAGGEEVRGRYRMSLLRLEPDGQSNLVSLASDVGIIRDSEILFVQMAADQTLNQATLSGGSGLAGVYALGQTNKLSDWLRAPGAMGPTPYTLFGVLSRRDPKTLLRTLIAFTPLAVMNGKEDMTLLGDDIVRVFSVDESRLLIKTAQDFRRQQQDSEAALRNPVAAAQAQNGVSNARSANSSGSGNPPGEASNLPNIGAVNGTLIGQAAQNAGALASDRAINDENTLRALGSRVATGQAGAPPTTAEGTPLNYQNQEVRAGGYASNREVSTFNQLATQLNVEALVLTNFLIDYEVTIDGAVRGPGNYIVGPSVLLQDLVVAAGGTVGWADQSGVELISTAIDTASGRGMSQRTTLPLRTGLLASYYVRPHDIFRFNRVFTDSEEGSVTVQGQVRNRGTFRISRGEHLSDLLVRAGGLTNTAYPYGTVFLRKATAVIEKEGYIRTANQVQDQLVIAMTRVGNDKIDPGTFAVMQSFVTDLRNQQALGRIAVVADPSVLAAQPALDLLLEDGDVVYIPQRPATISVLGQVLQPSTFPYRSGESVRDYIDRAGGYGPAADDSLTFVVLPDGSARRLERSWLSFGDASGLPPGSTIVVPRDITPFSLRQSILDISQVLGQVAVTVASLAVISKQ